MSIMTNPPSPLDADRTIENPVIGDRVTFLRTAAETGGESLLARIWLAPRGGNVMHVHTTSTERFRVEEGRLDVMLAGRHHVLGPGEDVLVPMNAKHRFFSTTDEPTVFTVEFKPARRFEESLRIAYGLARDGRVNAKSLPRNVWQLALLFELAEGYAAGVPIPLQKAVFGALAAIARRRGIERSFERHLPR